jgi:hypothetical protein
VLTTPENIPFSIIVDNGIVSFIFALLVELIKVNDVALSDRMLRLLCSMAFPNTWGREAKSPLLLRYYGNLLSFA